MKRHFVRSLFTGFAIVLFSGQALSSFSQNALTNGGVIQWAGDTTNVNQIYANYGGALVWDNAHGVVQHSDIQGAPWITRTHGTSLKTAIFCADAPAGQVANSVYYVYYAGYSTANSPTAYWHVISTVPPTAEGFPSGANGISYTIGQAQEVNSKAAIFLGSYVTDANGDMVPFERNGEEVIFAPTLVTPARFEAATAPPFAGAYNAQHVTFGTDVPVSASAIIADLSVTSLGPAGDVFVLDPLYAGVFLSQSGVCQLNAQEDLAVLAVGTTWLPHVRVKTLGAGSGVINFAVCAQAQFSVGASYVGYVEPIHHLF